MAKEIHESNGIPFYECYINSSLEVCEGRDPKGLYKKARAGEIKNFTGISDPYEAPENPDIDIPCGTESLDKCVNMVIERMFKDGILVANTESSVERVSLLDEKAEIQDLASIPVLEIDLEHAQYIQTIGEGWAHPLQGFMDEL